MGNLAVRELPDFNTFFFGFVQQVTFLNIKCLVKGTNVGHRSIGPELRRRMGVERQSTDHFCIAIFTTPNATPADEKQLIARIYAKDFEAFDYAL